MTESDAAGSSGLGLATRVALWVLVGIAVPAGTSMVEIESAGISGTGVLVTNSGEAESSGAGLTIVVVVEKPVEAAEFGVMYCSGPGLMAQVANSEADESVVSTGNSVFAVDGLTITEIVGSSISAAGVLATNSGVTESSGLGLRSTFFVRVPIGTAVVATASGVMKSAGSRWLPIR